ncbi:MAG: YjbQ family protein, partial [Bacteroidota bacterium]
MISQKEIALKPRKRGFHLITHEILEALGELPESGILHLFVKHTSAGITINENA